MNYPTRRTFLIAGAAAAAASLRKPRTVQGESLLEFRAADFAIKDPAPEIVFLTFSERCGELALANPLWISGSFDDANFLGYRCRDPLVQRHTIFFREPLGRLFDRKR